MLRASGKRMTRPTGCGRGQVGHVEHLDALLVADDRRSGTAPGTDSRLECQWLALADHVDDLRVLRVVERDDDEAGVAADVGVGADDRDHPGAPQEAAGLKVTSRA